MNASARARSSASSGAVARWFKARRWEPLDFQRRIWAEMAAGRSGLLHATTGAGKTLAVGFGVWQALRQPGAEAPPPLTTLWITPMRALAADTLRGLESALGGAHC